MMYLPHSTERFDLSQFGNEPIECLLDASQANPFLDKIEFLIDQSMSNVNFNPEQDEIILSGHVIITGLVLAVALARFGQVKCRVHDAKSRRYRMKTYSYSGVGNRR